MRYVLSCIGASVLRRLKSPVFWAVFGVILLLSAAVGAFPAEEVSAPVQVGIVLPEEGGEAFWSLLEARSGTVLTFHKTDVDTVDRNIAAGRWDCGIVLAEDFETRLKEVDMDGAFTIRIGPGSTVYPLVREAVSAVTAQLISPEIAGEYLLGSAIVEDEEALNLLRPRLEQMLDDSQRVNVTLSTLDGQPMEPIALAGRGVNLILCWVVSAVLLVWLLLCATDLARWIGTPAAKRMGPLRSATCLMAGKIGGDGILTLLMSVTVMLMLGIGLPGCAAAICYSLFWLAAAIFLAHFAPVSRVLPVCVPFIMVISLLLSSVLVDISLVLPGIALISRWLPARLFLDICQARFEAMAVLLGGGVIFLAGSFALDGMKKPRAAIKNQ